MPTSPNGADRAHGVSLPFPEDLVLVPVSRWPTTLPDETVRAVLEAPLYRTVPCFTPAPGVAPRASIIVVTLDGLLFTRLCLESVLAAFSAPCASPSSSADFEVIVVDNGSTDGTIEYLGLGVDVDEATIQDAVRRILTDSVRRQEMSARGRSLVDGYGAARAAQIVLEQVQVESGGNVAAREGKQ